MQNVEDIARMTPGFTVAPLFGGDATTPVIRGLSTTIGEPNVGSSSTVCTSPRAPRWMRCCPAVSSGSKSRRAAKRVVGRNTFGGAINFVTRRPTNEPEGQLEATFGNESRAEVKGTISGPLVEDRVFGRIAGSYFERGGYFTNELTGGDLDDDRRTAVVAASLEADLSDTLNAIWRISFESTDDGDDALRALPTTRRPASLAGGLLPAGIPVVRGHGATVAGWFRGHTGIFKRDYPATSLALDWQAGDYQVTAITGYNDLQTRRDQDNDFQAGTFRYLNSRIDLDEISQELRVSSPDDRRLRWMLGGYYYDLDVTTRNRDLRVGLGAAVPAFPPFTNIVSAGLINETNFTTGDQNFAIFGELGYDLTGQLRAAFQAATAGRKAGPGHGYQSADSGIRYFRGQRQLQQFHSAIEPRLSHHGRCDDLCQCGAGSQGRRFQRRHRCRRDLR